jgi:hypothetical protein
VTQAIEAPRAAVPTFGRGLAEGFALGLSRLPRLAWVGGGALLLTTLVAIVERRVGNAASVDRALHLTFSWIVPFMCLAMVSAATGPRSLREATWQVARFGVSRQSVAAGLTLAISLASVVPAVLSAAVSVVVAHTPHAPPMANDLVTTAWIGALTAWAYAAWMSFGAAFGKMGGGRGFVLALDFVLGGVGAFGVVFPRGDAMNLLGFDGGADVSQRVSSAALPLVAIVMTALTSLRCRD